MKTITYGEFEDVIKAQPFQLAEHLDKVADYVGKYSWLVVPKNSKNKVCLVAHIDTVFENRFETKTILKEDSVWSSPQGICGDDRCGIYALMRIYDALPEESKPYLLFTDGEECGGVGAREASIIFDEELKNVTYFIELDRQGSEDMVFYNNESKKFREYIGEYGFVESIGSFSDITILGRNFEKCSVNLSVGYYNQHSLHETINCDALLMTINKVLSICVQETGKDKVWNNKFKINNKQFSSEYIGWMY